MKKLVVLVVTALLAVIVVVGIIAVVNNNNTTTVASKATATATPAPKATATATPAPKATATAVPTVMSMPTVTAMPNIATAVPTNVPTNVSSYEISNETIVTDPDGSIRQMMIYASDLNKVGYKEIIVDKWNGVSLNCNTLGIVGRIFGRYSYAFNELKAGVRDEETVKSFFNANGEVFANNVREGYAVAGTQVGVYNLTNVRFVQLTGESYCRLVIVGNGNGNDYPVVTDKPAPTATVPPANTEEITTPPQHNETVTPKPTATVPPANTEEVTSRPRHNVTLQPEYTVVPTPAGVTPPPAPSVDDSWDDYDW